MPHDGPSTLLLHDGRVALDARSVFRSGERRRLTALEARLLACLAASSGDVPRAALSEAVWPQGGAPSARALDHLVARLRKKIEVDPPAPRHLLTVRGVGYRFVAAPEASTEPTLPASVASLVGREAELARIDALFEEGAPLVSIVGGPGIGKTRLSVEHAQTAADRGWHVSLVDLAGCAVADELPAALALALGTSAADLTAALCADVRRLVVLDNAEHLLPDAALHVAGWMSQRAGVRWLVTSREALRVRGEAQLPLGPLEPDAALRMFRERARRLGVHIDELSPVAQAICEQLERRPLALELAAGRLPVFGLDGLAAHLDDPLSTLRARSRDAPARHAGMAEAVAWSWEQLDAPERDALAACATFRADFSLEAACAVIGRDDAVELVERLVDRSLIERRAGPGTPRLHVAFVITEYVRARCAGEVGDHDERHARWTLGRAERVERSSLALLQELRAIVSRLAERHPALALEAALAAARLYDAQLEISERRALIARAAELADRLGTDAEGRVLLAEARLDDFEGDNETPLGKLDRAWALVANDQDRARIKLSRAWALNQIDAGGAEADAEAALALAESCGDRETQTGALHLLGVIARERGDRRLARERMQRGLLLAERERLRRPQSLLLVDLANTLLEGGELGEAARAYRAATEIAREMGDEGREAVAATNLAFVEHLAGDLDAARERHERALEVHRRLGNRRVAAFALTVAGALAQEQGELAVAERRLLESEAMLGAMHPMFHGYALACLGALWAELGDDERARAALDRAEQLFTARAITHARPGLKIFGAILARAPLPPEAATARDAFASVAARLHRATEARRRAAPDGPSPTLVVGPDAAYFEDEEHGRVTLGRRHVLRRILEALARERMEGRGRPLPLERVIEVGWPGERLLKDAAAARAYTAIRELRRAGLTSLLTLPDGYVIDPRARVERGA